MSGSRKIRVVKRDGSTEAFDPGKLAGAVYCALEPGKDSLVRSRHIALAVGLYLHRTGRGRVTSAAVFEMTVQALLSVGLEEATDCFEAHRHARAAARGRLRVCHEGGPVTLWDKGWLAEVAQRGWLLGRQTARLLAGEVEAELLALAAPSVTRHEVMERLHRLLAEYGLAEAERVVD